MFCQEDVDGTCAQKALLVALWHTALPRTAISSYVKYWCEHTSGDVFIMVSLDDGEETSVKGITPCDF